MLRDLETKKFNHYFYSDPSVKENKICQICGNDSKDHVEKDQMKEEIKENNQAALNPPNHVSNRKSNRKQEDNKMDGIQATIKNEDDLKKVNPIDNDKINDNPENISKRFVSKGTHLDEVAIDIADEHIHNHNKNILQQVVLSFPPDVVEKLEDPKLCTICYANSKDDEIIFSCNHKFCFQCIVSHISTKIINGRVAEIKCLSAGCIRVFSDEEVKRFVDNVMYSKYRRFKLNQQKLQKINETYNIVNCPHPDCEEVIEFDPKQEECFVECEMKHKFCAKCLIEGWHKKGDCKTVNNQVI